MQWIKRYLNNFSLSIKIGGGFAIVSLLLLVVTGVSIYGFQSNRMVITNVVEEFLPAVLASNQLQKEINATSASMGFYLLGKDDVHKNNYSQGLKNLEQKINELNVLSVIQNDEQSQQLLKKIAEELSIFAQFEERVLIYATSDVENFPGMLFGAQNVNPLSQQMLQIITTMILSEEEEEVSKERKGIMKDLGDMRYAFSSVMAGIRAYMAFRNQAALDEVGLYTEELESVLKRLQARSDLYTFEQEEGMIEFLEVKQQFYANYQKLLKILDGEKWRMDSYMLRAEVAPLVSNIILNAELLVTRQSERIKQASNTLYRSMDLNMRIIIAVSIGALLLVVLIVFVIRQISIKPLLNTIAAMKDIAEGDGDLTRRLAVEGKDEVANLAAAFNQFSDRIRDLIAQSVTVAGKLSEGVNHLEIVSEECEMGAKLQKEETSQVQAAIKQMINSTEEVTRSAHQAVSSADDAKRQATNGQQIVANASDAFASLASEVEVATQVIQQLQENSQSIGGMLDSIKDIAEQTNLLALNAAIEAARAGEQGRGFAVVADEVRTLATRTQNSTAEIEKIIRDFKANASEAVEVMARGQAKAIEGVNYSKQVDETLASITDSVISIANANAMIASAADQQLQTSTEIQQNVEVLTNIGEKSSEGAQQTLIVSAELAKYRDQLQDLMRQYKIS